ncbi:hypothetical protein JKG68_24990 [Microvirga aerilata]|uniref:Uncharacterized protein n=1 Tax=Microvirga aerilata TaxID=670292 RepID=A0A937D467_9HYPH|nr:hypothetical protein [Microvirga aerilata]MBL0407190.1 hypothetical protein [Microvirga aerilata]
MTSNNNAQLDENLVCDRDDIHLLLVIPGQLGPNGYPLGYMSDGSITELMPDEEEATATHASTLVRGQNEISLAYKNLWELVWYQRHQESLHQDRLARPLTPTEAEIFERAKETAQRIRETHTIEELNIDEFDYGLVSGRMSALAWVLGTDWDESLDT